MHIYLLKPSSSECSAQGHVFHCKFRDQGCNSAARSSSANSGTNVAVLLGMNRCGSFPLLFRPHYLFSIWTDLKRSENIPEAPTWGWGEWIWLTGPSGRHRNSLQGLNISSTRVFHPIRDPDSQITLRILIETMNEKIPLLNHSQNFHN